jgi:type II secretory pathway pseudopilin PulG
MRNLIRLRNDKGDTIVEVLIVLAVLSLAFSISYATANNGLRQSTTAQQHSNALSELDSQLELLRGAYSQNANIGNLTTQQANEDFCFNNPANLSNATYFLNHWKVPANGATDNFANYNGCSTTIGGATYYYSIDYNPGNATTDPFYDLRVRWQGLGTEGAQQEELTYKINPLSTADAPFSGGMLGGGGGGAPTSWSWTTQGASYSNCVDMQPPMDTYSGCFRSGSSEYSWRNVAVNYPFSGGTTSGTITFGAAYLVIDYSQFFNGPIPPANYNFNIQVQIDSGTTYTINLPVPNDKSSFNNITSAVIPITMPTASPGNIKVTWLNNVGNDPNLQINSIQLNSLDSSTPGWSTTGYPYYDCQVQVTYGPDMCGVSGSSTYSYVGGTYGYPPFVLGYNVSGLTADASGYKLEIDYSNNSTLEPGITPVPASDYNITVTSDNGVVGTYYLPIKSNGSSQAYYLNIPAVNGHAPTYITTSWGNDEYVQIGGTLQFDNNFQLDGLKLTGN